jgi:hypothetical protein
MGLTAYNIRDAHGPPSVAWPVLFRETINQFVKASIIYATLLESHISCY